MGAPLPRCYDLSNYTLTTIELWHASTSLNYNGLEAAPTKIEIHLACPKSDASTLSPGGFKGEWLCYFVWITPRSNWHAVDRRLSAELWHRSAPAMESTCQINK
jgi:hypothetical protein